MFDGVAAVVETLVVDDPDAATAAAIGRVTTAELTMQILVLGQWHRRTPDLAETSCGVPVRMVETPMRREVLTFRATQGQPPGDLCPECFTGHEIKRAIEHDLTLLKAEEAAAQKWMDEAPQRADEREQREAQALAARARARRNTNRGDC
jgi:hypothetical protein